MIKSFFLNLFFILLNTYLTFRDVFFYYIDSMTFVYYVKGNKNMNITWHYLFRYGVQNYKNGVFYVKSYNNDGYDHVMFQGEINNVELIKKRITTIPKRRQINLLKNGVSVNYNLEIIDNYKKNIDKFDTGIKNLEEIFKILNVDCNEISIVEFKPFKKCIYKSQDIDIEHLYY